MKLEFQLLVVDDNPSSIQNSVALLRDHLEVNGFSLKCHNAADLSPKGMRTLALKDGRNFNLVAVDFNLGRSDIDGAGAAAKLRKGLRYTDMVFYSSDPGVNLLAKLAEEEVPGVFVASRDNLDETLKGLADTVIGKAVDLNHMRGIAMAEVAEMDVLMEEVLEKVFGSPNDRLVATGKETLEKLLTGEVERVEKLRGAVAKTQILDIVTDSGLFSSMQRFKAINRVCKLMKSKPTKALETFKKYESDIIQNRNTLAHAKEDMADDGTITLRAIKRGRPPVTIDDAWMRSFRGKLREQKVALTEICTALEVHLFEVAQ
ncbi:MULTISPECIES: hypothetical protein [unclassified Inquilinus]|uniref:hypothetical protein n=1 Tax=unclassified Inquilinus TaxID=2645927 RepID=UPI003F930335